ncbi:MAG: hypothetical protein K9H16_07525 [Bacteroidales bacterium]|nr:hypothetical protein [Bacteroidales bacterium]
MKIAIPTSDRIMIFERTGQSPLFAIVTLEDLNITHIEYRVNPPHTHTGKEHSHPELVNLLHDCDLLLVRKLGKHLKNDLEAAGLKFQITVADQIGSAIHQYLSA